MQPGCPGSSVDRLPVSPSLQRPPSRAQTVTNNLAQTTGAAAAGVKDTNIRGYGAADSMDGVETVRVTDMTSSSAFTKSIGSLFSTINRSVSSAFNSLMAAPAQSAADDVDETAVKTTATTPTQPTGAVQAPLTTVPHQPGIETDATAAAAAPQQTRHEPPRPHHQADVPDWSRVHPQLYTEPSAYRGQYSLTALHD